MKRKISKIFGVGLALVLVLSLSLVAAVPAAADSPADTDVGFLFHIGHANDTAEWSTTKAGETDAMGDYSVKLAKSNDVWDSTYIEFIPVPGTTVSDLATIGDLDFWYWYNYGTSGGPGIELQFTMPNYDPATGYGHVDVSVQAGAYGASNPAGEVGLDAWANEDSTINNTAFYYGNDPVDGTPFQYDIGDQNAAEEDWIDDRPVLSEMLAEIDAEAVMVTDHSASAADWELTRVRIELYGATERICYIDDITIDGTTYELEPIFLDAEYYSVGDTVEVTVPNFGANADSFRINPVAAEIADPLEADNWTVSVTTTSDDTPIIFALEETGASTGVFTGSFTTTTTLPVAEDEVYVEDGDEIAVTYTTSEPYWGAGDDSGTPTSITALVDDTIPTINTLTLTPEDGEKVAVTMPEISADYSDTPDVSGIDEDSVEMFFDGVDVTDDATATTSGVTYTPEDDLVDGSYEVTVNVSDLAGNEATETWSFRVVSWLVDPESVVNNDELDELDTVGVAVSITPDTATADIEVGRYASNPEPEAALTFTTIEDGFFDVKVTNFAADATQIVIKFADDNITAESTAYVWDDLQGTWLACSDQGYNPTDEYLWLKVRVADTTPNISELGGTPFAIGGEPAVEDILAYYKGLTGDAEVVDTTDLLTAANDWADAVVPPGFTEAISTTQLLALANEWAATE